MRSLAIPVLGLPLIFLPATVLPAQEEPAYVEVAKLLALDGGGGDNFGEEIALDGDTLVVRGDDIGPGAAYVFERNQGGSNAWREVKKLVPPDPGDQFGEGVDVEGDLILVGTRINSDDDGAIYTYERNAGGPGNWGVTAKLLPPDGPQSGRNFVLPCVQGDTLLVGASGDDDGGAFSAGAVYIFSRDESLPSGWRPEQKVIASDSTSGSFFGFSCALDGDTFVTGAYSDDAIETNAGAAYVFERGPDGVWTEQVKLTAPEPDGDDRFGYAVGIEGDRVVVGNRGENNGGAVYVYGRDIGGPGNWGLEQRIAPDDPDPQNVGEGVAIGDGKILVGGPQSGPGGRIYVFEQDHVGQWTETFRASETDESDNFGITVAIDGKTLLVGAKADDDGGFDAGAAYVYQAVAHPVVSVTGVCPGELTVELNGATPGGSVLLTYSENLGQTILPTGPCGDVELGLESAQLLTRFLVDDDGEQSLVRVAPAGVCGLYLQVVDRVTCGVGPVARIP